MENSILDTIQMLLAKQDGSIIDLAVEQTAEVVRAGMEYARKCERKNDNWDIIWAMPMPEKDGERSCEIVIGNRHTRFEPFVAWHCFDGESYAWGHYCQTFGSAFDCAMEKIRKELGM